MTDALNNINALISFSYEDLLGRIKKISVRQDNIEEQLNGFTENISGILESIKPIEACIAPEIALIHTDISQIRGTFNLISNDIIELKEISQKSLCGREHTLVKDKAPAKFSIEEELFSKDTHEDSSDRMKVLKEQCAAIPNKLGLTTDQLVHLLKHPHPDEIISAAIDLNRLIPSRYAKVMGDHIKKKLYFRALKVFEKYAIILTDDNVSSGVSSIKKGTTERPGSKTGKRIRINLSDYSY